MSQKNTINPFEGNLQKIVDETTLAILSFKPGVTNQASLPLTGNSLNDARITNDTHNLFIWNGTVWTDQGGLFNINWGTMTGTLSNQIDLQSALDSKFTTATDTSDTVTEGVINKFMTVGEESKLAGIETSATADQTDAEIKTAYENNVNTNEFSDTEQTKLTGIETNATADQTDLEIKTAYENNANTNVFSDTEKTKLVGIEPNATADQTAIEISTSNSGETVQSALDSKQTILPNINKSNIQFVISPNAPITTGLKGFIQIPFSAIIDEVRILGDQTGSVVLDIWKDTFANYPPTVADTITAGDKPTIVAGLTYNDLIPSGWNTVINEGDILGFNIDSVTTFETLTIILKVTRT